MTINPSAETIRIATRKSQLAMAQTAIVAEAIRAHTDRPVEVIGLDTRGDRTPGPLATIGGKGLFTQQLECALRSGEVDLAVHSAKDMPARLTPDMRIVCCLARGDVRDALVTPGGVGAADLPEGASVGTGSGRRGVQLLDTRADLQIQPIRGNVQTRLAKIIDGECDAVVLAMAGLERSGLLAEHAGRVVPLDVRSMVPAAGQGVLAVQALRANRGLAEALAGLDDAATHDAWRAERQVVRELQADCTSPLGVYVYAEGDDWLGLAMVGAAEPLTCVRVTARGAGSAERAGTMLAERLIAAGGKEILARQRPQ